MSALMSAAASLSSGGEVAGRVGHGRRGVDAADEIERGERVGDGAAEERPGE